MFTFSRSIVFFELMKSYSAEIYRDKLNICATWTHVISPNHTHFYLGPPSVFIMPIDKCGYIFNLLLLHKRIQLHMMPAIAMAKTVGVDAHMLVTANAFLRKFLLLQRHRWGNRQNINSLMYSGVYGGCEANTVLKHTWSDICVTHKPRREMEMSLVEYVNWC